MSSKRNKWRDIEVALAKARAAFEALSPEEQEAHRQAQKESWVRAERQMDRKVDYVPLPKSALSTSEKEV